MELGEKCVTALSVGIPLAVLLPLGLLAASQLPVISEQFNTQIQTANTEIQKQLGLFNPQLAAVIADADAQLRTIGADLGQVAGGIAVLVAAAGLIGGIASQCVPEIKQSSEGS